MMKNLIYIIIATMIFQINTGQNKNTDANIFGHVACDGEHIPFATISIKGRAIGTSTDETGHYQLINLPEGKYILTAQSLGYKPIEIETLIKSGETKEVNFELEKDVLGLQEVVVTGNRTEHSRKESTHIINTISSMEFKRTQSINLNEGLNFCPGIRTENNCQNCGFSQVRINGMEGHYSQILINSMPIFSGLVGVYGLDLIPSTMIDRVEVSRGSGSVLYGSNAIAGTINLILKDPVINSYELGINSGIIGLGVKGAGDLRPDNSVNFNSSILSTDGKTGMALYGFYRNRKPFDANDDGFSEIASINSNTIGTRVFHRFGKRNKLNFDFFNIKEKRRGGDKFDYPEHEAGIAESVKHDLISSALTYKQYLREHDVLSIFLSGINIKRNSYYGAEKSLSDYGKTKNLVYSAGIQYDTKFETSKLIVGIENRGEWLEDIKEGYPDINNAVVINDTIIEVPHTDNTLIADQKSNNVGVFAQYEITSNKLRLSAGIRLENYAIKDKKTDVNKKTGNVINPALNIKYDFNEFLQGRIGYSQGYRAPQIFDEDLHIETAGSRKVIHKNSPDLKQENSHSISASLDLNKQIATSYGGFLLEGFYTILNDPFVNEFSKPDENGVVTYTRTNSGKSAIVYGINIELNFASGENFTFKSGFTVQTSRYEEPHEFGKKEFFRTPKDYGYLAIDWQAFKRFGISSTTTYTGKMFVPYFGNKLENPDDGILKESKRFFDTGIKLRYTVQLNGAKMEIFSGVKNIFNSYQDDFDAGIDRDPGYIYGPVNPRIVYLGIRIGNFIR